MQSQAEKIEAVRKYLANNKLDATVTGHTLQEPSSFVTPLVLLRLSEKLVKISRKEATEDDRDNLMFSRFIGPEDVMAEHVERDAGRLQSKALIKAKMKKDLSWMHAGYFTPQIRSTIIGNQLAQNMEGINPMEYYDVAHKVSKMGVGGITSTQGIPSTSRQVNGSQFGFMDTLHMVESDTIGVVNYFARNVRKGNDGKLYRLVLDKDKKPIWVDHETLLKAKVEIPEN